MAMALAARSVREGKTSDGRIPCPVCRQQIHPVAGRCKHCKTDLVKLREQQGVRVPRLAPAVLGVAPVAAQPFAPQAPAPAPARLSGEMAAVAPPPAGNTLLDPAPYLSPGAAYGPDPTIVDLAPAMPQMKRARWPIFVAIGAAVAIVVCIILLVMDDKPKAKSSKAVNGIGLGTDSMDTDVAPPPPTDLGKPGNPWGDPTDTNPADPVDPPDPYQPPPPVAPQPPPSTFNGTIPTAEDFYPSAITAVCKKLTSCGNSNSTTAQMFNSICQGGGDLFGSLYADQIKNGQCTYDENAAGRCLASIDAIDCNSFDVDKLDSMLGVADCSTALSCPAF